MARHAAKEQSVAPEGQRAGGEEGRKQETRTACRSCRTCFVPVEPAGNRDLKALAWMPFFTGIAWRPLGGLRAPSRQPGLHTVFPLPRSIETTPCPVMCK